MISGRDEYSVSSRRDRLLDPLSGPDCGNSGRSATHSASDFEVKDMPASFIVILHFTLLIYITYVFCYCGTLPVNYRQSIVKGVGRRSVLGNILRKSDKVGR